MMLIAWLVALGIGPPWLLSWWMPMVYRGPERGKATVGVGLLLLATPLWLPCCVLAWLAVLPFWWREPPGWWRE